MVKNGVNLSGWGSIFLCAPCRCNTNTQGNLFSIESRFPNVVYISILYLHTYFIGIGKYVERLRKLERDANSVLVSHEQKIEDSYFFLLEIKG